MLKRLLKIVVAVVLVLVIGVPLIAWLGSYFSLDRDYAHTEATASLEVCSLQNPSNDVTLCLIETGSLTFRARVAGLSGTRGNVMLLHGFPESSVMYEAMMPVLARAGFRVIAFDQRGYSPGARPEGIDAYTTDKLGADVYAVADAVGFDDFHLIGHDWGAAVGWLMVFENASRIRTWTSLSIPHMGAYAAAIAEDPDQQERSAYVGFFRMPFVPEMVFSFNGFRAMRNMVYAEHSEEALAEYMSIFSEPGALTAALNWYRASGLTAGSDNLDVDIPTAFIWGKHDAVVGELSLKNQRRYFDGNLTELELDTGHWLMETHPREVTAAVLLHLEKNN